MMVEVGVANTYTMSDNLPGDACYAVIFPEPGNTFFTSFTIYDVNGYLLEGNSHISSYAWESEEDGSITIHFNCEGAVNNITSSGNITTLCVATVRVRRSSMNRLTRCL